MFRFVNQVSIFIFSLFLLKFSLGTVAAAETMYISFVCCIFGIPLTS